MSSKQEVQRLFREAEVYRSQGLLAEARAVLGRVEPVIRNAADLQDREALLETLGRAINTLEQEDRQVRELTQAPRVSAKAREMIKQLFSSAEGQGEGHEALAAAASLADFGQFDRALEEFEDLLGEENVRVAAAQGLLRCHLGLGDMDAAVACCRKWVSGGLFAPAQVEEIKSFLGGLLKAHGKDEKLEDLLKPGVPEGMRGVAGELLEFSSLEITFEEDTLKSRTMEMPVGWQSGDRVRIRVTKDQEEILEQLRAGTRLNQVRCFAPPAALMNASARVISCRREDGALNHCSVELQLGPKPGLRKRGRT